MGGIFRSFFLHEALAYATFTRKGKNPKMTEQSNVAEASLAGRLRVAESSRGIAVPVLLLALILGGGLRFDRLGAEEMNRSEAAAWTAASAPTVKSAIARTTPRPRGAGAVRRPTPWLDRSLRRWGRDHADTFSRAGCAGYRACLCRGR